MAGTGTHALFERVKKIATELKAAGDQDWDAERGISSSRHTIEIIDAEAVAQQDWRGEDLRPDYFEPNGDANGDPNAFGNQIGYLHNEFNFDVAHPIGGLALITHISFIPIFPPKFVEEHEHAPIRTRKVKLEEVSKPLNDRMRKLRNKAVHAAKGYEKEGIAGGKDSIIKKIGRFLSYYQGVITSMRSIERTYDGICKHYSASDNARVRDAAARAQKLNEEVEQEVREQGFSSRLSMSREYALRLSPDGMSRFQFSWSRHHSHYQMLTVIEHTDPSHAEREGGFDAEDCAAVPTLCAVANDLRRPDGESSATDRTAFDSLPADWADLLFGRYLQGANYLLLPVEWLFSPAHLARCAAAQPQPGTTHEEWGSLCARVVRLFKGDPPAPEGVDISVEDFKALWFEARKDKSKRRAAAELAIRLLRPLIAATFGNPPEQRFEFVMCGAAEGAAIMLSDVRNFGRKDHRALMSASLIIDLGMNDFERGRLIKHMTEFSTQRFLALSTIGSFRFFSDALDVLNEDLSKATNIWIDEDDTEAEFAAKWWWQRTPQRREADRKARQQKRDNNFITDLQDLTISLTMLNSLVSGGILMQSAAAEASRERVMLEMEHIGHYELPGFMSFKDFLDRRFFKSVRNITTVGRRYELLRLRVAELSALVGAKLQNTQDQNQISQSENQNALLSKVDRLTMFGIVYYAGQIIAYSAAGVLLWAFAAGLYHPEDPIKHESLKKAFEETAYWLYPVLLLFGMLVGFGIALDLLRDFVKSKATRLALGITLVGVIIWAAVTFLPSTG